MRSLPLIGSGDQSRPSHFYRWPEWIRICKDNNLTRSMSAKGCEPDSAAVEDFFGRLKQEFFHKRCFRGCPHEQVHRYARRVHGLV